MTSTPNNDFPPEAPILVHAPETTLPNKGGRRWKKVLLYILAGLGVLTLALIILMVVMASRPKKAEINEVEMLDAEMTRAYGKYSEEQKGWLYVGTNNRTFVIHVVQQAKIRTTAGGDEFYFVASGAPLDGSSGAMYGVFQVRMKPGSTDGSLIEVSSPVRYEGNVAVRPEQVSFENFAKDVWGWVIKVQDGSDPKASPVRVHNVVLAPHGDDIAVLASFNASKDFVPSVSCDEANRLYAEYEKTRPTPAPVVAAAGNEASESGEVQTEGGIDEEEPEEPLRCNSAKWTYRTTPNPGLAMTPLIVTRKGVLDGKRMSDKTWKLIFNNKSFEYTVPKDLLEMD